MLLLFMSLLCFSDMESSSPPQIAYSQVAKHHLDNSRSPTTSEHFGSMLDRESSSPKKNEFPCMIPSFNADQSFRSFYQNGGFKSYAESLFSRDRFAETKNRYSELYAAQRQVTKTSESGARAQDEKETPVLKFSVNAILGSDHGKHQPFAGKRIIVTLCLRLKSLSIIYQCLIQIDTV